MKKILVIVTFGILFTSCRAILYKKIGITPLKQFSQSNAEIFVDNLDLKSIPYEKLYFDTTEYNTWCKMPKNKDRRDDFSQPLCIMYFDNDTLASFHANCYANPKRFKIDWNIHDRFETFIPKSAISLDSVNFSIWNFTQYLTGQNKIGEMNEKYPVFFIYTTAMKKIATSAIHHVVENAVKFDKVKEMKIYFINIDKPMIYYKVF
ncbi:MAG: hypothetical protein KF900_10825 [Bacteroidetes bacterium]|nr:hypothetical protein [Bacteroidota bacterium]